MNEEWSVIPKGRIKEAFSLFIWYKPVRDGLKNKTKKQNNNWGWGGSGPREAQ